MLENFSNGDATSESKINFQDMPSSLAVNDRKMIFQMSGLFTKASFSIMDFED